MTTSLHVRELRDIQGVAGGFTGEPWRKTIEYGDGVRLTGVPAVPRLTEGPLPAPGLPRDAPGSKARHLKRIMWSCRTLLVR